MGLLPPTYLSQTSASECGACGACGLCGLCRFCPAQGQLVNLGSLTLLAGMVLIPSDPA